MKHINGTLKEIEFPSYMDFETVCRDILIEEGIVKTDNPLDYNDMYWSNILERELGNKYVVVQDWCLVDRLFEICRFESEIIEECYDFMSTSYDKEYVFDIVCDVSEALSRAVYGIANFIRREYTKWR